MSLWRTVRNLQRVGVREWWRQLQYIGDAKSGTLVGADQFGNRYFENRNGEEEVPGRHRWVDFVQHDFNATQVPPEWHSWLSHIRQDPPAADPVIQNLTPPWKAAWTENLTGTPGAYKSYNTVVPKINAWDPKVRPRV
ncbi:NDUFA12-domain-containing protein [Coprinopsis marcescibilis]|uniref:NADH dehydrogenase [ubiquinone] 1 alpha subcomplex subunit n=1 Tax=Coprinopsis marcescibilis TaxID=230819 RepID=A0A5C3L921_COPMA|nr:NDUFA12-domain-containing protein [Coprinopsis marcescibilis]